LLTLGSTLAQPNLAGATALPGLSPALAPTPLSTLLAPDQLAPEQEPADQSGGSNDTRPGPIVQQAFGLLMDHFVTPPDADEVLNGGLDGAQDLLASKDLATRSPAAGRPSPASGART